MSPAELPDPHVYVLWCAACRRQVPVTDADIGRFAAAGWPRCCDRRMMCYSAAAAPPEAACRCCDRRSAR